MSQLSELFKLDNKKLGVLAKFLWGRVKNAAISAILTELEDLDVYTVLKAKDRLARGVQLQRKVPGVIRGLIEKALRDIDAKDVAEYKAKARAFLLKL